MCDIEGNSLLAIGLLDFNFLENKGGFHSTPQKLNFLKGGQQQGQTIGTLALS